MADTTQYEATFDLIDTDDDGLITQAEFKQLLDLLGGGSVPDEIAASMFAKIDVDTDGKVNLDELATYLAENPA